jgi:hypothetical protein
MTKDRPHFHWYLLTGIPKFVPEVVARMVQAPIADPEFQRLLAFGAVWMMLS